MIWGAFFFNDAIIDSIIIDRFEEEKTFRMSFFSFLMINNLSIILYNGSEHFTDTKLHKHLALHNHTTLYQIK